MKKIALLMSNAILTLLISLKHGQCTSSPDLDLPTAKIYEVDEKNRVIRGWTKIESNYETVIENVENIRLQCTATHPVQWVYKGNGIPVMRTSISFSRTQQGKDIFTEYKAVAFITPIKTHHTGKYICTSTEYDDVSTYFYLFVPGQSLFTSLDGKNVYVAKDATKVIIPCSVSNPKAKVTLEKSVGEVIEKIRVRGSDAIRYDPKVGFHVDLKQVADPEGIYVCTARYGELVRGIEYTVIRTNQTSEKENEYESKETFGSSSSNPEPLQSDEPCKRNCGSQATCERNKNGEESCVCKKDFRGDSEGVCEFKCEAHTDCPTEMSCYVDRRCRNPCIHSLVRCGRDAKCKVEKHRPVCYCPPDFVGDAKKQCFNTLQGSDPENRDKEERTRRPPTNARPQRPTSRPSVEETTNEPKECNSDRDCADDEQCYSPQANKPKQCIKPCAGRNRCGNQARCQIDNHRPRCECLPGFTGDARKECSPLKLEIEPAENLKLQAAAPNNRESYKNEYDVCNPADGDKQCGSYASCQKTGGRGSASVCLCNEGYEGLPPDCTPQCDARKKCRLNQVCLNNTFTGYPTCVEICGRKICGADARCDKNNFSCYCSPGYVGDPLKKCNKVSESALQNIDKIGKDCTIDSDCGRGLRCETGPNYRKCVDPCIRKKCSAPLQCVTARHTAVCACPEGYTGSELIGCTKDAIATPGFFGSPCSSLNCGLNGECRVLGGRPRCFCQPGYVGTPPECKVECRISADCEWDQRCVQGRCRDQDQSDCNECGLNTKCKLSVGGEEDEPKCSCLDGFQGDPKVACLPV